ncbi:hypothetical protein ACLMJK_007981 [Lecanora helva]
MAQEEEQLLIFTKGPAKFVLTNDGETDCVALLVTQTFLDKLNDMFQQDDDLDTIQGPAISAKMDIEHIQNSMQRAQEFLSGNISKTETDELRCYLRQQESRLSNLCQRRDELEEQCTVLKREISRSSNYAHYVLKTAMESAGLLKEIKTLQVPRTQDYEPVQIPPQQQLPSQNLPPTPTQSPEEIERQEAYEEMEDCYHHLEKVQRLFDDRDYLYQKEVEKYKQGYKNGHYDFPRSELDRYHLEYGMRLTGTLVNAEKAFEKAKARRDALEAASSESEAAYEQEYLREQAQFAASTLNWRGIEKWRAGVEGFEVCEDVDVMSDSDGSDAGLVEISDSLSARDCGQYRRKIDRWQEICGTVRRPKGWPVDEDRRHSA